MRIFRSAALFVWCTTTSLCRNGVAADASEIGTAAPAPTVEDFDINMGEAATKLRMKDCFTVTLKSLKGMKDHMQKLAQVFMKKQNMTEQQAINHVIVARVMNCYMNINDDELRAIESGTELSSESMKEIFGETRKVAQKPRDASKRQWLLLDSVMKEEMKSVHPKQPEVPPKKSPNGESKEQQSKQSKGSPWPAPPRNAFSWTNTFLYVLVPLGCVFTPIGLLLWVQHRRDTEHIRSKISKAEGKKKK